MQVSPTCLDFNAIVEELVTQDTWIFAEGTSGLFKKEVGCPSSIYAGLVAKVFSIVLDKLQPDEDDKAPKEKLYSTRLLIDEKGVEFSYRKTGPNPIYSYDPNLGVSRHDPQVPPPAFSREFVERLKREVSNYLKSLTQDWEEGEIKELKTTVLLDENDFGKVYHNPNAVVWLNRKITPKFAEDNLRSLASIADLYNAWTGKRRVEFLLNERVQPACLFMMGTPENIQKLFSTIRSFIMPQRLL